MAQFNFGDTPASLINLTRKRLVETLNDSIIEFTFHNGTELIIQDGITYIGDYAFSGCPEHTVINIPASVTRISSTAFYNCAESCEISCDKPLSELMEILEDSNYCGFTNNTIYCPDGYVILTDSLDSGIYADVRYYANTYIIYNDGTPTKEVIVGDDGILTWELIGKTDKFETNTTIESVEIGSDVISIGDYAFYRCSSLNSISIPSSVTSIEDYIFESCKSLTSIEIPSSVTSIEEYTLAFCSSLTAISIPSSVTSIGQRVFYKCTSLTSITFEGIPPTSVGSEAFPISNANLVGYYLPVNTVAWEAEGVIVNGKWNGMTMEKYIDPTIVTYSDGSTSSFLLEGEIVGRSSSPYYTTQITNVQNATEIIIGKSITSIGNYAFRGCSNLTSITIPSTVISLGDHAFRDCYRLASITIPEGVKSISNYMCYYCSGLTSVTIPEGVTTIGQYAFRSCTKLTSITIPSSVTFINVDAFAGCSKLTSITFEGNPPDAYTSSFPTSNTNLVGYYLSENASAWEAVITDGKWNGITMLLKPITYSTGGNGMWTESNGEWTSPTISHSQSAYFQAEFTGEKTLSFAWKVSSENNYDWLTLYIDGTQITRISGTKDWTTVTKTITGTGEHIVKWTYSKNRSLSSGSDKGWVKDISIT